MGDYVSVFINSEIELSADFVESLPVPSESEPEQEYIVIGNFVTREDPLGGRPYNISSGFNKTNFFTVIEDFRLRHGLEVNVAFDDSVVLEGAEKDFTTAVQELGPRFSYAHTNAEGVEAMIEAERDFARENPGASIYKGGSVPSALKADA